MVLRKKETRAWSLVRKLTPYYDRGGITLYLGDCREILPQLDVKVDLVLTDPPYGLAHRLHDGGTWGANPLYDEMLVWDFQVSSELIEAIIAMGKEAIVWGGHLYGLVPSRNYLAWVKREPLPTLADFELAWTNFDKPSKMWDERRNPDGKRRHPTQKPISLMMWCIMQASNPESILDPFLGSGTTAVAAKKLGRKCIGIEVSEKYLKIAVERLRQEVLL